VKISKVRKRTFPFFIDFPLLWGVLWSFKRAD
jgi:hypothetical protein